MLHVVDILYLEDLPTECIEDCSGPGAADEAVAYWLLNLEFTVDQARAIDYLAACGGWSREELEAADDDTLAGRILWLACGDFNEYDPQDDSCGSDIFVLEG